jgi:hypothetical protein
VLHNILQPDAPRTAPARFRSGTTLVEVLVAFTLLTTVMVVSVPLVVRHGRLLITARHHRLAVEELSNQLDRLTAMPEGQVQAELKKLAPTAFTEARLPGVKLSGQWQRGDIGGRITLCIVWDEAPHRAKALTMAAWVVPQPRQAGSRPTGGDGR